MPPWPAVLGSFLQSCTTEHVLHRVKGLIKASLTLTPAPITHRSLLWKSTTAMPGPARIIPAVLPCHWLHFLVGGPIASAHVSRLSHQDDLPAVNVHRLGSLLALARANQFEQSWKLPRIDHSPPPHFASATFCERTLSLAILSEIRTRHTRRPLTL